VTLQTLTSCALWWKKLDWWVIDILLLHLLSVLSRLQFASLCTKSIRKKWSKNTVKASTMRRSPLTVGPSMIAEAEKHMDGEINTLFCLTLWMRDTIPLTIVDCFLKVCSIWWGAGLQRGNAVEAKFIVHVFWSYASCISDTLKLRVDGKSAQNNARRAGDGTRRP
jgi:hypothetical protein